MAEHERLLELANAQTAGLERRSVRKLWVVDRERRYIFSDATAYETGTEDYWWVPTAGFSGPAACLHESQKEAERYLLEHLYEDRDKLNTMIEALEGDELPQTG